jgi:hypothetical protein
MVLEAWSAQRRYAAYNPWSVTGERGYKVNGGALVVVPGPRDVKFNNCCLIPIKAWEVSDNLYLFEN